MKNPSISFHSGERCCSKNAQSGCAHQETPRFFTINKISDLLGGKSPSTIYRWIAEGKFPAPVKVCGSSMWPEEVFAEWRKQLINQ